MKVNTGLDDSNNLGDATFRRVTFQIHAYSAALFSSCVVRQYMRNVFQITFLNGCSNTTVLNGFYFNIY